MHTRRIRRQLARMGKHPAAPCGKRNMTYQIVMGSPEAEVRLPSTIRSVMYRFQQGKAGFLPSRWSCQRVLLKYMFSDRKGAEGEDVGGAG